MKKKTNHNIERKPKRNIRTVALLGDIWRVHPPTEGMIEKFAHEIKQMVIEDESITTVSRLLFKKGIGKTAFYSYIGKYPVLEEAFEFVKMCIGMRREEGGLEKRFSEPLVAKMMPYYDIDWKKIEEWRSELKAPLDDIPANQKLTIVMQPFPNSDLVPEKKEIKE